VGQFGCTTGTLATIAAVATIGCGRLGFDSGAATEDAPVADAAVDTPGVVGDPRGSWVVDEALLFGEQTPRTRADLVNGVRADVTLAETTGVSRLQVLQEGLPTKPAQELVGTYAVDGDRWVFDLDGQRWAYVATWVDGDHVDLVFDEAYPGTTGDPPIVTLAIARGGAPAPDLPGNFVLVRTAYAGTGEFETGTCAPDGAGGSWMVSGNAQTSSSLVVSVDFQFINFDSTDCSGGSTMSTDVGTAYLETGATTYQLWMVLESVGSVTMGGTLTRVEGRQGLPAGRRPDPRRDRRLRVGRPATRERGREPDDQP